MSETTEQLEQRSAAPIGAIRDLVRRAFYRHGILVYNNGPLETLGRDWLKEFLYDEGYTWDDMDLPRLEAQIETEARRFERLYGGVS